MKKFVCIILCLVMALSLAACGSSGSSAPAAAETKIKTIGINQYGEHGSLDNCRIGFIQGLEQAGLKEGVDFRIDYQNAQFDDNINSQIAASFSANNVDLMCAIATLLIVGADDFALRYLTTLPIVMPMAMIPTTAFCIRMFRTCRMVSSLKTHSFSAEEAMLSGSSPFSSSKVSS